MNNEAPEDEMILAELIAAASEHRLRSCVGNQFMDKNGYGICQSELEEEAQIPPKNATSCCALGAVILGRLDQDQFTSALTAGNDGLILQFRDASKFVQDWNIGATFEIVMRLPRLEHWRDV